MNLEEAKNSVLNNLISAEIGSYTCTYAPDRAVIAISNLVSLTGLTKYGCRKACKALIEDGMIEYTSQGCPAIVSYGEVPELVCDARPPINGYALTKKAFESERWKQAYEEWNKSMEDWANGRYV